MRTRGKHGEGDGASDGTDREIDLHDFELEREPSTGSTVLLKKDEDDEQGRGDASSEGGSTIKNKVLTVECVEEQQHTDDLEESDSVSFIDHWVVG